MRRWIGLVAVCLVAASVFAARYSARSAALGVDESSTRFLLEKGSAIVLLALKNPGAANLPAQIKLELLNPRDTIHATAESEISIPPGASVSKISLTKIGAGDYNLKELLWLRLRYRVEVNDSSNKDARPITGIISLSEITPDIFRLLVSAPQEVGKEAKYTIRVRTLHPLTGAPISSVKIDAEMAYEEDDKEHKLKTSSMTNSIGIARVLAMEKKRTASMDKAVSAAFGRALDYLGKRAEKIGEPYLLASYALAAIDAGETVGAEKAAAKLQTLAREESGTSYWNLESNTPFYSWGLAGRIETTALALTALKRSGAPEQSVDRGLLFLLRNKDRYGVWLSGQATINVLDALLTLNETEKTFSRGGQAEIIINGRRAASVAMPPGNQLTNPVTAGISQFLGQGNNRIEIRHPGDVGKSSVQIVETHYVPWKPSAAVERENIRLRESSALRLAVSYDKTEVAIGESVTCNVVAERITFKGYGMLLAEIGLPPGADVDRSSLEEAMKASGWELNHYDVMPDRVVVYLWPCSGGTKFSFKFKLRYGIKAQTAPSGLYDYYNPEARAVVAPAQFVVR